MTPGPLVLMVGSPSPAVAHVTGATTAEEFVLWLMENPATALELFLVDLAFIAGADQIADLLGTHTHEWSDVARHYHDLQAVAVEEYVTRLTAPAPPPEETAPAPPEEPPA